MSNPVDTNFTRRNNGNFSVVDDADIGGGLKVVATTADRDAILSNLRKPGMLVAVQSPAIAIYQLQLDGVTWLPFTSGAGTNDVGTIIWTPGVAWATIAALIAAVGGACTVLLDCGSTPGFNTFHLTGTADLSRVKFVANGNVTTQVANLVADPGFALTVPMLDLDNVYFTASTTLYSGALGGSVNLRFSTIERLAGTIGPLFDSNNMHVFLDDSSAVNDDATDYIFKVTEGPPQAAGVLGMVNGATANGKVIDGHQAGGSPTVHVYFSYDDTATFDANTIGTHVIQTTNVLSQSALSLYTPAVPANWPEGAPTNPASALDKIVARSSYDPNAVYALSLPGGSAQTHVDCGVFWSQGASLGNSMYWRAWIKKNDNNGGYIVSDSYGGGHALLWNVDGAGNIFFLPVGLVSYGSDDVMPVGQWYEIAVAITNDSAGTPKIVTYFNGIPSGATDIGAGNVRAAPTGAQGSPSSVLYIGGSTHINANFQIAQMQAFDMADPWSGGIGPRVPQRFYDQYPGTSTTIQPDFYMDFTKSGLIIPDLSWGYAGGATPTLTNRTKHNGKIGNSANGLAETPMAFPIPKWVSAADGPWTHDAPPTPPGGRNLTPLATPTGAKIFDSFQREDQTFAFSNAPTLGSTESGSLGAKAWQQGVPSSATSNLPVGAQWGIFNGYAVFLDAVPGVAWVNNDSADMDVAITGRVGNYGNGATGVAFRVQDKDNFWTAFHYWDSVQNGILILAKYVNGTYTGVASTGFTIGRGQHTIDVQAVGSNITVFLDGVSKLTTTDAFLSTATGAGVMCPSYQSGVTDWGLGRWGSFTVK